MNDSEGLRLPPQLEAIESDTRAIAFGMASERLTGALLRSLAASKPAGELLEVGTGTGLATAWLLDGMSRDAQLTSVDFDAKVIEVARRHLGADRRLSLHCADGNEFLAGLAGRSFDLIFADTWAGKYESLDATLELLAVGGLYVIDDMLPQANWPEGHAPKVQRLLEDLSGRRQLQVTRLSWASGLVVATRVE